MSVYVDQIRKTERTKNWPFVASCHMTADTLQELHTMAVRLKMRPSWFQKRLPHYDLTFNKRIQAVQAGAVEVDSRELLVKAKALKEGMDNGNG